MSRDDTGWTVHCRDEGGPVFSAVRGAGALPPQGELAERTATTVRELVASAGQPETPGWIIRNITSGLLLASTEIAGWEGEEWAVASHATLTWAPTGAPRVPYAWLRARTTTRDAVVETYQDDAAFGLSFLPRTARRRSTVARGSWRPRREIGLVTGVIRAVEIVYDTTVPGCHLPGLVTEALLHGERASTLLVAADAYGEDEWHLYDDAVVALSGTGAADALDWIPSRRPWRPISS